LILPIAACHAANASIPIAIEGTNKTAAGTPSANDARAGPGHMPASAHPTPNSAAPLNKRPSRREIVHGPRVFAAGFTSPCLRSQICCPKRQSGAGTQFKR
jgi:hypothetical protein